MVEAFNRFIEARKLGGILLPNILIVEGAYHDALIEVELRKKERGPVIIGKPETYPIEGDEA